MTAQVIPQGTPPTDLHFCLSSFLLQGLLPLCGIVKRRCRLGVNRRCLSIAGLLQITDETPCLSGPSALYPLSSPLPNQLPVDAAACPRFSGPYSNYCSSSGVVSLIVMHRLHWPPPRWDVDDSSWLDASTRWRYMHFSRGLLCQSLAPPSSCV